MSQPGLDPPGDGLSGDVTRPRWHDQLPHPTVVLLSPSHLDDLLDLLQLGGVHDDTAGVQALDSVLGGGLGLVLDRVLGCLVKEGAVRLGAALRLGLPVTLGHIPLLAAHLQMSEDTLFLGAVASLDT